MRCLFSLAFLVSVASGFREPTLVAVTLPRKVLWLRALPASLAEDALAAGMSRSAVDAALAAAAAVGRGPPQASPFLEPADVAFLLPLFKKYVLQHPLEQQCIGLADINPILPSYSPSYVQMFQSRLEGISAVADGGYSRAERQRMVFYSTFESFTSDFHEKCGLAAIDIRGDFLFVPLTRQAVAEALRSLLEPAQVDLIGDVILLGERGAQVVVAAEVASTCLALTHVSGVPVSAAPLSLPDLAVRPPMVKDVMVVEASMRLDAVGSAGLGISRSKLAGLIKKGEVTVNWRPVMSSSSKVREGDTVAVRGSAKVEILSAEATAKGKWRVSLRRTF